jgi:hypothetical protein
MSIDACNSSFDDLAKLVLPQHMVRLRASMAAAHPLSLFGKRGFGSMSILSELDRVDDFSGCYVLLKAGTPSYVGFRGRSSSGFVNTSRVGRTSTRVWPT